ncbi:MAG TPA: cupredoxin domain-containing protein [Gaiellaceae bacterium]|jgi:plastocyanin|nr:cupredoxin domain-containing protein [Gaiellaceae bacterium]
MPFLRRLSIGVPIALVAAFLLLAAVACGGGSTKGEANEGGMTTIAGLEASDHGTKDVSGESEVDVELDDNYFDPTVLKGDPGQKVKLELENEGKTEHNLTIAELSLDQDVAPGEKAEVAVTFPQSGTLSFFCKYHKSLGMAGALEAS